MRSRLLWLLPLSGLLLTQACTGRVLLPPPRALSPRVEQTVAQLKDINDRVITLRTPSGRLIPLRRSTASVVSRQGMRIDALEIARGTQVRASWREDSKGDAWLQSMTVLATPVPSPYWANSANNNQPNSTISDSERTLHGTYGEVNP